MSKNIDIMSVLKSFYEISGFRVSVHDFNYNEIYSYPEEVCGFCKKVEQDNLLFLNCKKSYAEAIATVKHTLKPYIYRCNCGLYGAVVPICRLGGLLGYIMLGKFAVDGEESLEIIKGTVSNICEDKNISEILNGIPVVAIDKIDNYINLLKIIAEYITQSNMLESVDEKLPYYVRKYLHKNYNNKISLDELCFRFGCCKSSIMNNFKKEFNVTVTDYLTAIRMEKAEEYILTTEKSIKEIALSCGFSDQNYFSRLFSKKYGRSPTQYRNYMTGKNKENQSF